MARSSSWSPRPVSHWLRRHLLRGSDEACRAQMEAMAFPRRVRYSESDEAEIAQHPPSTEGSRTPEVAQTTTSKCLLKRFSVPRMPYKQYLDRY